VSNLRERGAQFLKVPSAYYTDLKERLKHSKITITEDLAMVTNSRIS
jgi:4-hydroxyphenylpyruvate dioxygenase